MRAGTEKADGWSGAFIGNTVVERGTEYYDKGEEAGRSAKEFAKQAQDVANEARC